MEELVRVLGHSDASGLIFADEYWPLVRQAKAACPRLEWLLAVGRSPDPEVRELGGNG
jgi:hypothetical protein